MRSFALFVALATCSSICLAQYVPPDLYDEEYNKAIGFWENKGQIVDSSGNPTDVEFYSEGGFPRAYLREKSKVSFTLARVDTNITTLDTTYRLDMWPHGSGAHAVFPIGLVQKDWHQNFYMSHCGTDGVSEVQGYSRVVYESIYNHIDMHFYSGSISQKMAFVLRPGCDPSALKLAFDGQDSMGVDIWGNLKMYFEDKQIVLPFVKAYQVTGEGIAVPMTWQANYQVDNGVGVVGFTWSNYNAAWPLVFQIGLPPLGPSMYDEEGLCWSTYMGGGERDNVYESVEDENGNYYIAGTTGSTFMSFPPASGINYSSAGTVAYAMRYNTDDDIEWKTFYGGNAAGELTLARGIAHKSEGQVYMAGSSYSETLVPYQQIGGIEYYQPSTGPGYKGFICRFLKETGERTWATYFGENDVQINGMVGLGAKKIFIVGSTMSTLPELDVPAPPAGSTYWPYSEAGDGFVCMFNEDDEHAWRTHIPGNASDVAYDVDTDGSSVVVAGVTLSTSLNLVPFGNNSYSDGPFGEDDCFLFEFDDDGAVLWSTYVGSQGIDVNLHNGIAIDTTTHDIVLVGQGGVALDVVPGPGWYQDSYLPTSIPAFIARFSGIDRSRTWHTYAYDGPNSGTSLTTCAFDPNGNLIVAGHVDRGTGMLLQPLPGLYQQSQLNPDEGSGITRNADPILMVFGPTNELLYGSYFGGEAAVLPGGGEMIYSVLHRMHNDNIYFTGFTSKADNLASYFPLDDGGGVPYFEGLWQGGTTEGFLAALCGEALNTVGIEEDGHTGNVRPYASVWQEGRLTMFGIPAGQHAYQVFDPLGRIIAQGSTATHNAILELPLHKLEPGSYFIQLQQGYGRFTVTQ